MANIFDKEANKNILERLEKLTPDSDRQWGKMSPAQMLVHCQKPIEVVTGKLVLKGGLLGFLFGKMAKNNFLKSRGFSKNSPTHPLFKVANEPDFEKEKRELISQVTAFAEKGPDMIATKKHPFFGWMTDDEWGSLMYVHLDHHLKQFGL
jgi:hypothetical protein